MELKMREIKCLKEKKREKGRKGVRDFETILFFKNFTKLWSLN